MNKYYATIKNQIYTKLDIYASICGLLLGILISLLYLISPIIQLLTLGVALSLASTTYLLIVNKKEIDHPFKDNKRTQFALEILYFIFFSLSLLLLHMSSNRPLLYFLLISLCTVLLVLSIYESKTKYTRNLQIIKTFGLAINIRYSIFYCYAGSGVDYWEHLNMNNILSQVGNIDVLFSKEPSFPLMHIQVAMNKILTDLPIKDATNFAILLPLVFSALCVFLVAKKYFNENIGLLAMLIFSMCDFTILWGAQPQTTSFGLCLFSFLIFILFKKFEQKGKYEWTLLSLALIIAIILSHAVSSFIAIFALLGLFIGSYAYKILFGKGVSSFLSSTLGLFGLMLLAHWLYAIYNQTNITFFQQTTKMLNYYIGSDVFGFLNRQETIAGIAMKLPPFIERFAETMGLTILVFFSVIGCLFWLRKDYCNSPTFSIIGCITIVLGFTLSFPLFGLENIIPGRWFAFIFFFMSIACAFAIFRIVSRIQHKGILIIFFFLIISGFTFFMIVNTTTNMDSPLWLKESTVSTTYTEQELKGPLTISQYSSNLFSNSRYARTVFKEIVGIDQNSINSINEIFNSKGDIFIWRNYMISRPIQLYIGGFGVYKGVYEKKILGNETLSRLNMQNKIYENDDIIGFI